ncbi:MAG TPA: PKD domain-containing protein [Bacteroidales bacterium]|nr:PKD domain-containing protein [Bacteroidales bacterium]HPS16604.1 PKD domain-containing protein [Bacteroidales bacterium]
MTWGRKNGDASNYASWLPVCTYTGMDSLLNSRYRMMADSNNAILSPVGAVWHYLRQNFPLMELYQTDESHPSVAGTYAAACSFYVTLFRKDPTLITYNSSLPDSDAVKIKNAARLMVYDSFAKWYIGEYDPLAAFNYFISGVNQITFTNSSVNTTTYNWNFGDGDTTSAANPTHQYATAGLYSVTLIATKCKYSDNITQTINVNNSGIQNQGKENLNGIFILILQQLKL